MEFEWSPEKADENVTKHGVSFEEAATVFDDPLNATIYDSVHSEDEIRWRTIGYSSRGRLVVVSHTERGARTRLISAQPPTRTERESYERG